MDYSKLKGALSKGPLISGTSESDGLYLRELVWIECLKALIQNTKNDETERGGITPDLDRIISRNVNTACKYAGQFMSHRATFDTCYAAPLLLNRPDAYEKILADPNYPTYSNFPSSSNPSGGIPTPGAYELDQYGINTPLIDWEYDQILDRYSAMISIDLRTFDLHYGCGWDYCQTKIYIEDNDTGVIHQLAYNPLRSYPEADTPYQYTPEMFPFTVPSGEKILKSLKWYDQYPTQADIDADIDAMVRCPNGVGINTENGIDWNINPYNYNKDDYNAIQDIISNPSLPFPSGSIPLASTGGFKPSTFFDEQSYNIKIGYKCANSDGNCTGTEYFSTEVEVKMPWKVENSS